MVEWISQIVQNKYKTFRCNYSNLNMEYWPYWRITFCSLSIIREIATHSQIESLSILIRTQVWQQLENSLLVQFRTTRTSPFWLSVILEKARKKEKSYLPAKIILLLSTGKKCFVVLPATFLLEKKSNLNLRKFNVIYITSQPVAWYFSEKNGHFRNVIVVLRWSADH